MLYSCQSEHGAVDFLTSDEAPGTQLRIISAQAALPDGRVVLDSGAACSAVAAGGQYQVILRYGPSRATPSSTWRCNMVGSSVL
jgi:hypothetical protein